MPTGVVTRSGGGKYSQEGLARPDPIARPDLNRQVSPVGQDHIDLRAEPDDPDTLTWHHRVTLADKPEDFPIFRLVEPFEEEF